MPASASKHASSSGCVLLDLDTATHILGALRFEDFHWAAGCCRDWHASWRIIWLRGSVGIPLAPRTIFAMSLPQLTECFHGMHSERVAEALFQRVRTLLDEIRDLGYPRDISSAADATERDMALDRWEDASDALMNHGVMEAIMQVVRQSSTSDTPSATAIALELAERLLHGGYGFPAPQAFLAALDCTELRRAVVAHSAGYRLIWTPWQTARAADASSSARLPDEAIPAFVNCARRALRKPREGDDRLSYDLTQILLFMGIVCNHPEDDDLEASGELHLSGGERKELLDRLLKSSCPEILVALLQRGPSDYTLGNSRARWSVMRTRIARLLEVMCRSDSARVALAVPALVRMMLEHGEDEIDEEWDGTRNGIDEEWDGVVQQERGARMRALLSIVRAGGESARELATVAGARQDWLVEHSAGDRSIGY